MVRSHKITKAKTKTKTQIQNKANTVNTTYKTITNTDQANTRDTPRRKDLIGLHVLNGATFKGIRKFVKDNS